MDSQYKALAEQFENVKSLDMIDNLIQALQQRKDEIIEEAEDAYREEEEVNRIKEEMDCILRDSQKKMLKVAKGLTRYYWKKCKACVDDDTGFYLGIKYSELLDAILITMKGKKIDNLQDYCTYTKNKERLEGIEYLAISMSTDFDEPRDIYTVDDYNDIIIQRNVGTNVIIPY